MGLGPSSNPDYSLNLSSNTLRDSDESFFEVNFDDLLLSSEFHSDLLNKPKDNIENATPPNENIVADIITDPTAFASVQTSEEAWVEVLAPLFTGSERKKPYIHRLYAEMFRFFSDRPNKFIENEENRKIGIMENLNRDKPLINRTINQYENPKIPVDQNLVDSINSLQSIKNAASLKPITSNHEFSKHPIINYSPSYIPLSRKLKALFHNYFSDINNFPKNEIENAIMILLNWGFFTGDLSCVIESLTGIFKLIFNNIPQSKFSFPVQHYLEMISKSTTLTNSINYLNSNAQSVVIPNFNIPKNPSCSLLACDGNRIYIISGSGKINTISLNKAIVNTSSRFQSIQLNMISNKERVNMGIAISNGYAYVSGRFMPKPYIFHLPSFELVKETFSTDSKFTKKSKLNPPFTSDGKFIYTFSVRKMSISIYSIEPPKIKLYRVIQVKMNEKDSQNPLFSNSNYPGVFHNQNSDQIPKIPDNKNFPIFTNGTVLTIALFNNENNGQFYYTMRHFSLIDGTHISDNLHIQKWPLFSIVYDPWTKAYWGLSPEKEKTHLVKLPNYSAQPLWLTGWISEIPQLGLSDIFNSISSSKNLKALYQSLNSYISFVAAQFNGCSFKGFLFSHVRTTHIFAPCTPELIHTLMSSIKFYVDIYINSNAVPKFIKKVEQIADLNFIKMILFSYMSLLNYNLSNFEPRVFNEQTIQLTTNDINDIIDFLASILEKKELSFLYKSVAFIFANSFSIIIKEPSDKISEIFKQLYLKLPEENISYLIDKINRHQLFPYLISSKIVREVFHPILISIVNSSATIDKTNFICSFIRSMILELKKVYTENQVDIPESARKLSDTFIAFANLMTEETASFLNKMKDSYHEETFKFHPFARLLSKWLIMLEPFTQFNRLSKQFTALLQVFFTSFSMNLDQINASSELKKNGQGFSAIYMIYYEIFSEYLNFLTALLNGGTELKEATQYSWLIKSTIEGNITINDINSLVENLKNNNANNIEQTKSKKQLLSRGFSFNINQSNNATEKRLIVDFVSKLTHQQEYESSKILMDYLYTKFNNPFNKRLNKEQRWIERLLLGAFSKQLGVSSILFDISMQVSRNETPQSSQFVKPIMDSIYKIRRNLTLSKQKTNQFRAKCEQNMTPPVTDKLEENYEEFFNQIVQKSVFLLHIQPCLQFQSVKFEEDFPLMLKNLTFFITSTITVENYFKLIIASNNSRRGVQTGIQLINDFLRTNKNIHCNSFLIDRFSSSGDIINFLSTLEASSKEKGVKLIVQLMQILRQIITDYSDYEDISTNSVIVLYANLILSIAKISDKDVIVPLSNLLEDLTEKHSGDVFRSYLSFVGSVMTILYETNPEFSHSPEFSSLIRKLFPNNEINESTLPIARICYKAGLDLQINYSSMLNLLKGCNPSYYHSISTFLIEILIKTKNKIIEFLSYVMREIGYTVSGKNSIIMKDRPIFDENANNNSEPETTFRSVNAICSCVSELIQFCRRVLVAGDDTSLLLKNIFDYVLTIYSPDQSISADDAINNDKFTVFQNKIFIYAIFAILSNSIDGVHTNSILKNEEDNSIYYIESIDQINCNYKAWKLPITKDSEIFSIKFSSKLLPVSIMPFTSSSYTNYKLLNPFFLKALSSSDHTFYNLLVLMSFKEYSSNNSFISAFLPMVTKELLSENSSINFKNFSFIDTNSYFQNILYSHLKQNSNGFNEFPDKIPQFYSFSPYNFKVNAQITNDLITCDDNIHMFVTSPLSLKMKGTLKATFSNCTNFQIGAYILSTYESGAEYVLLSCANRRLINNDNNLESKLANTIYNNDTIYIKNTPEGTNIYINNQCANVKPLMPNKNPISFIIITYEKAAISYSIQVDYHSGMNSGSSNSCTPSFAPLAGQAIFKRNKNNLKGKDIQSILKMKTIYLKTNNKIEIKFENFRNRDTVMTEEQVSPIGINDNGPIVSFPNRITSNISTKININPSNELANYLPETYELYSEVRQTNSLNINAYDSLNTLHAFIPEGEDKIIYSNRNTGMKFINKFNGDIQESVKTTLNPNSIPLINLFNYSILPPKIINHFSTSYLSLMKNEALSSFIIKSISAGNSVDLIMDLLNKLADKNEEYSSFMNLLVQIVIRLFLLLEPINIKADMNLTCPIDFNLNVLQSPPRIPSLHLYLSSLQKIMAFVTSDPERLNEFVNEWFNVLKNQFHDGFSHSAQPDHPHAIMRTFSNLNPPKGKNITYCNVPYSVVKENTKYIIARVGFVNPTGAPSPIKNTYKYNYVADNQNTDEKLLYCNNSLRFNFYQKDSTYVAIPYSNNNNDTLVGTFFDLIISLKYFAIFAFRNSDNIKSMKLYRTQIYSFFFESLIARSPFFSCYPENIIHFLGENLIICGSDIKGEYIKTLNLLAVYYKKDPIITSYLVEQETLFIEQSLIQLKTFFPQFQTKSDEVQIKEFMNEQKADHGEDFKPSFEIPLNIIPNSFYNSNNSRPPLSTINNMRRLLKYNQESSIAGFPFHFLFEDWVYLTQLIPPFEISSVSPSVIKIKFLIEIPTKVEINYEWLAKSSVEEFVQFQFSTSEKYSSNWHPITMDHRAHKTEPFDLNGDETNIYLRIIITNEEYRAFSQWSNLAMFITTPFRRDSETQNQIDSYGFKHHDKFVNDIRLFTSQFKPSLSQDILDNLTCDIFQDSHIDLNKVIFDDHRKFMNKKAITISNDLLALHIKLLQAKFLCIINWLVCNDCLNLKLTQNKLFMPYVWKQLKVADLRKQIVSHSNDDDTPSVRIHRKAAGDIRLNISTNLSNTIICQMTNYYSPTSEFRVMSDRPFSVKFTDEEGIDAGGLARELVAECADDFCCPLCGLVVPTPNSRNDTGDYKDCVIPIANPQHSNIQKQYETAGAMMAISARSELVQNYNFPPLVWEYLVTGELNNIDMIFDIDQAYKNTITSLQEALKSEMTEEAFQSKFKLKFVVNDSLGNEVPLTQRGKTEPVTLSNCGLYISLANKFRLNEMKENLDSIRKGLWSNFNFEPTPTLDGITLEFACCGQKEITLSMLKSVTEFRSISDDRQFIFWRVVEEFTPAERSLLLKFSTARINLPPQISDGKIFLYIDDANTTNTLPTSSTCFHRLHLPTYTSFEIAYKMIKIAVECAGTFENS